MSASFAKAGSETSAPDAESEARRRGARAAWNWRASATTTTAPPPRRRLAIQGAIGIAFGTLMIALHRPTLGSVAVTLASASLLLAVAGPAKWIEAVHHALDLFAKGVGKVVTVVVLTAVYFLFFLPVGVMSRGKATARFQRAFDPKATTYWRPHAPGPSQTERQF